MTNTTTPQGAAAAELRAAAESVVARWDSPNWKDEAHTADFIDRLREALKAQPAPTEARESSMQKTHIPFVSTEAQGGPVMWFEAEASAKGKTLRYVLRNSMFFSTRMHTSKPEVMNNALWPLYEHPALTEAAQEVHAPAVRMEECRHFLSELKAARAAQGMSDADIEEVSQAIADRVRAIQAAQGEDSARRDPVVEANRALLHERSQLGIQKYGGTLDEKRYPLRELLVHGLLEALDMANYLQAAIQGIDRAAKEVT